MPCYHPIHGYRGRGGVFSIDPPSDAMGLVRMTINCRQCIGCRIDRAADWTVRIMHEAKCWERNCFLTLTYEEDSLPEDHSLNVRDWQLFMKRWREAIRGTTWFERVALRLGPGAAPLRALRLRGPAARSLAGPVESEDQIRFYMCGEYGETNGRPHYHAAIFGQDFSEDRVLAVPGPKPQWHSAFLDRLWGKGFASIGSLTPETAAYVAGYVVKKQTGPKEELYQRVDDQTGELKPLLPPFALMSRGGRDGLGGIGRPYLDDFAGDIKRDDTVVIKGRARRTPRAYLEALKKVDPDAAERLVNARAKYARTHKQKDRKQREIDEYVHLQRVKEAKRRL